MHLHLSVLFVFFINVLQLSLADPDTSFECGVPNLAESADDKSLHPVEAGNFPWYAAIYHKKEDNSEVLWKNVCSGTLITSHSVLTAAVCLHQKTPEDIKVVFGKLTQDWNNTEPNEIKRDVKEIQIHEGYTGNVTYMENNIGLLILSSEVPVSSFVCLAFNAESLQATQTQPGYVVGWNTVERPDAPASAHLSYAQASILNHSACAPFNLPPDSYCNGTELILRGSGNLGTGLTFVSDGHHFLYGVVSLSVTHEKQLAGAYTNVSYHYNWIKDNMS